MGQIANEYYKNKQQQESQPVITTPAVEPPIETPQEGVVSDTPTLTPTPIPEQNFINEEAQIKRFGSVVGSDEYYASKKAEQEPINKFRQTGFKNSFVNEETGETVGEEIFKKMFRNVDDETWDKMSRTDQAKMIGGAAVKIPVGLITTVPIEIIKTPFRAVLSTVQLIKNLTSGKPWNTPETEIYNPKYATSIGEIPTYFKSKEILLENGFSETAANTLAGLEVLGDAAIIGSSLKAVKSLATPKMTMKPGQQLTRTDEIQKSLQASKINNTVSEYAKLTDKKVVVGDYGGKMGDTYLKVTTAGPDSVEVAVVQRVKGLLGETRQWFKNKTGTSQPIYKGGFGKEIKLSSDIVPVKKVEVTDNIVYHGTPIKEEFSKTGKITSSAKENILKEGLKESPTGNFGKGFYVSETKMNANLFGKRFDVPNADIVEFSISPNAKIYEYDPHASINQLDDLGKQIRNNTQGSREILTKNGFDGINVTGREIAIYNKDVLLSKTHTQKTVQNILTEVRETPLKGQGTKLIVQKEIDNLNTIALYKGLDDATVRAISKVITGKQVIGELTNAEYTALTKVVGTMSEAETLSTGAKLNMGGHKYSPPANYSRYVEETTGVPLASEIYIPVEDAFRFAKNDVLNYSTRKNNIFGEYNGVGFAEERRLITSYIKGDKDVILKNEKLIPKVKEDLVRISNELTDLYKEAGQFYDVSMERFGELYQPGIREVGNFQVYKQDMNLDKASKSLTAFARFQKRGSVEPLLEDSSSLFDIYVSSLSKEKYIQPVLKNISEGIYKDMPKSLKQWADNYVGEKLGYASEFERKLNTLGTKMNEKLGTNIDPEVIRNMTDNALITVYSGALGMPRFDAPIRDLITTTMIGYGRMGPRFYGAAVKKSMTKSYLDHMRTKGRLVEFGIPGGEDIAKARTGLGPKSEAWRDMAQTSLKPYGVMDNSMRAVWSAQAEMQFDDLIARYNAGKISWDKVTKDLQLDQMGAPVRKVIEQRLLDKNIEGARDLFANSVIDEISFPYRKGTGAPITYGIGGSLLFNLSNWTIHFGHTMGRWVKTGQWGNFMRFVATGAIAQRSLAETLGIDTGRFTSFLKIANPTLSPTIQLGVNLYNGMMAVKDENRKAINATADTIVDTVKNLGVIGGVGTQNWKDFFKSYNSAGQPGVPEGKYRVFNQKGATREFADFADILFRGLGFQTVKETETSSFLKTSANVKEERAQATDKVEKLIIEGVSSSDNSVRQKKINEATDLIKEFQITKDFSDVYEDYNRPLIMSAYERFDPILKARFAKWYGELLKGEYNIKK